MNPAACRAPLACAATVPLPPGHFATSAVVAGQEILCHSDQFPGSNGGAKPLLPGLRPDSLKCVAAGLRSLRLAASSASMVSCCVRTSPMVLWFTVFCLEVVGALQLWVAGLVLVDRRISPSDGSSRKPGRGFAGAIVHHKLAMRLWLAFVPFV